MAPKKRRPKKKCTRRGASQRPTNESSTETVNEVRDSFFCTVLRRIFGRSSATVAQEPSPGPSHDSSREGDTSKDDSNITDDMEAVRNMAYQIDGAAPRPLFPQQQATLIGDVLAIFSIFLVMAVVLYTTLKNWICPLFVLAIAIALICAMNWRLYRKEKRKTKDNACEYENSEDDVD